MAEEKRNLIFNANSMITEKEKKKHRCGSKPKSLPGMKLANKNETVRALECVEDESRSDPRAPLNSGHCQGRVRNASNSDIQPFYKET